MLLATNAVFDELLTNVLPAWLSCESVQYLIGIIIFGYIFAIVLSIFKRKK